MTALDRFFLTLLLLFIVPIAVVVLNILYFQLMMLLASKLQINHPPDTGHKQQSTTLHIQPQLVAQRPLRLRDPAGWRRPLDTSAN